MNNLDAALSDWRRAEKALDIACVQLDYLRLHHANDIAYKERIDTRQIKVDKLTIEAREAFVRCIQLASLLSSSKI